MAGLRTFAPVVALALFVASGAPVSAQDWDCSDMNNLPQQGINMCLAQQFRALDAQMQATYAAVLARLPEEDTASMRAGQLAWVTYRQMMCDVEAGAMRGGSGEPMMRFGCLARITETRARELEEMSR